MNKLDDRPMKTEPMAVKKESTMSSRHCHNTDAKYCYACAHAIHAHHEPVKTEPIEPDNMAHIRSQLRLNGQPLRVKAESDRETTPIPKLEPVAETKPTAKPVAKLEPIADSEPPLYEYALAAVAALQTRNEKKAAAKHSASKVHARDHDGDEETEDGEDDDMPGEASAKIPSAVPSALKTPLKRLVGST